MAASFATADDYTARGNDATPWGTSLDMKLAEASRIIRSEAPDVDARIEKDLLDAERVIDIVCAMVSRAVPLVDLGIPQGVESAQIGVDVFQQSLRFGPQTGGGAGALYLSKNERRSLGVGVQRAFMIHADIGTHHARP